MARRGRSLFGPLGLLQGNDSRRQGHRSVPRLAGAVHWGEESPPKGRRHGEQHLNRPLPSRGPSSSKGKVKAQGGLAFLQGSAGLQERPWSPHRAICLVVAVSGSPEVSVGLFPWPPEAKAQAGGTTGQTPCQRRARSSFRMLLKRKKSFSYTRNCFWDPDR